MTAAFDPTRPYVRVEPAGRAEPFAVTPQFWGDLIVGRRAADGWLVTSHLISRTGDQWEMHRAGEALILLSAGMVALVLASQSSAEAVRLDRSKPPAIVPRGIWHRVRTIETARVTFVTFGRGTQHKPAG